MENSEQIITRAQLVACMPNATQVNIDKFLGPLNETFQKYQINTPERVAAFLAQIEHESGSLRYVRELASGDAYEGRISLGNTEPGDGKRFKGRGLIQITGRANYQAVSIAFGVDFIANPEWLEQPKYAALSAGWFWNSRKLNELADLNTDQAFEKITKRINGGLTHHQRRVGAWIRCKRVFGI